MNSRPDSFSCQTNLKYLHVKEYWNEVNEEEQEESR